MSINKPIQLGICCINTILRSQKPPIFSSRRMIVKTVKEKGIDELKKLIIQNLEDTLIMMDWNENNGIKVFRLSSELFPHKTNKLVDDYTFDFAIDLLKEIGRISKIYNQRLTFHPGQYNVVGSPNQQCFEQTCIELKYHADILDLMELDHNSVMVVHGGGTYGDKQATIDRWCYQFTLLPDNVKRRLVLENCEKSFSIIDCLEVSERINIPVVFDTHHFDCYKKLHPTEIFEEPENYMERILNTWKRRGIKPKFHVSEQGCGKTGHHSDYINEIPQYLLEIPEKYGVHIDIMIEAKMKEQAIIRLYEKYPELNCKIKPIKIKYNNISKNIKEKHVDIIMNFCKLNIYDNNTINKVLNDDTDDSFNNNKISDKKIKDIINDITKKFGKYNKNIETKIRNINKAGVDNSIPCTTKRVSQSSRMYLPYNLIKKNNITLEKLQTYENGICIGISPSKFKEFINNSENDELDDYIINNIGSDKNVSAIIVIIKTSGYSGSSKEREEKKILDELIKKNDWKPIVKKTKENKGNDKWEGHYYYNISGGEQNTLKSWEGKEEQIFTTYKGFMSNTEVINVVKASLIYMMLFVHDINKVFNNINDVDKYKIILENYLRNKNYLNNSSYQLIRELKCFDKNGNLISPIICSKISIDDFCVKERLNISHNIAVSKNIILYCNTNKVMLSDYRPGNLFWDFEIANMRQQDDTIEEYWIALEKSIELRKISYY